MKKSNELLIANKAHDQKNEHRNPIDGRSTIGCLLVSAVIFIFVMYLAGRFIILLRS